MRGNFICKGYAPKNLHQLPGLVGLKRLDMDLGELSLHTLEPIFQLPNIETMKFRHGHMPRDAQEIKWSFTNTTLKYLSFTELSHCGVAIPLHPIAEACTSLSSLEFHNTLGWDGPGLSSRITDEFSGQIQSTLQHLVIQDGSPEKLDGHAYRVLASRWSETWPVMEVLLDLGPISIRSVTNDNPVSELDIYNSSAAVPGPCETTRKLHIREVLGHSKAIIQTLKDLSEVLWRIWLEGGVFDIGSITIESPRPIRAGQNYDSWLTETVENIFLGISQSVKVDVSVNEAMHLLSCTETTGGL